MNEAREYLLRRALREQQLAFDCYKRLQLEMQSGTLGNNFYTYLQDHCKIHYHTARFFVYCADEFRNELLALTGKENNDV